MSKTSVRRDIEKSVEEADDRDIFEKALDNNLGIPAGFATAATLTAAAMKARRLLKPRRYRETANDGMAFPKAMTIGVGGGYGAIGGSIAQGLHDAKKQKKQNQKRRKD